MKNEDKLFLAIFGVFLVTAFSIGFIILLPTEIRDNLIIIWSGMIMGQTIILIVTAAYSDSLKRKEEHEKTFLIAENWKDVEEIISKEGMDNLTLVHATLKNNKLKEITFQQRRR